MRLDQGWNQIQFNLADFCRKAYNTGYVETLRIQLHCSCRVRRVYFSDRLYAEDELPPDFKLFVPMAAQANLAALKAAVQEQAVEDREGRDEEEEYAAAGDAWTGEQVGDGVDYADEAMQHPK
jgi:hypothetical protein